MEYFFVYRVTCFRYVISFNPHKTPMYYSHSAEEETAAQSRDVPSSETHTVLEPHFEPQELDFRVYDLTQGIL